MRQRRLFTRGSKPKTIWTDDSEQLSGPQALTAGAGHHVFPIHSQDTLRNVLDNRGSLKRIVGDCLFWTQAPSEGNTFVRISYGLAVIQTDNTGAALSQTSPDANSADDLDYPWLWTKRIILQSDASDSYIDNMRVLPTGADIDINVHRVVKPEHAICFVIDYTATGSGTVLEYDYRFRLLWGLA